MTFPLTITTIESPSLSYNELKRFRNVAPLFVTTEMQNIIINAVDSFYILSKLPKGVASKTYAEQQKKIKSGEIDTTPINTDIDSSKFDNIREGSDYLRQVLVIEEENSEEQDSEKEVTQTNVNYIEETQMPITEKTKYTNDKMITDHYAIIPTGQGFGALKALSETHQKVFEVICRRFLAIFMPPAEYKKVALTIKLKEELFTSNFKMLTNPGYLDMMTYSFSNKDMVQEAKNGDDNKKDDEVVMFKLQDDILGGLK